MAINIGLRHGRKVSAEEYDREAGRITEKYGDSPAQRAADGRVVGPTVSVWTDANRYGFLPMLAEEDTYTEKRTGWTQYKCPATPAHEFWSKKFASQIKSCPECRATSDGVTTGGVQLKHDLRGKRYGTLTATRHVGAGFWECVCDCGKVKTVPGGNLRANTVKSCGVCREVKRPDGTAAVQITTKAKAVLDRVRRETGDTSVDLASIAVIAWYGNE